MKKARVDGLKAETRMLCLRSALALAFLISFMFFIYEPITCYLGNVNEFSFSFVNFMGPMIKDFFGIILLEP